MTKKDLKELFKEMEASHKKHTEFQIQESKKINDNIKALILKSKELDKTIPNELLVITYANQPVGMWFYNKYKEWLN